MIQQSHEFDAMMRRDIARWSGEAVAAERAGFADIARTIRQWIAEGESLIRASRH